MDARRSRIVVRNLGGGLSRCEARSTEVRAALLGETLDFMVVDEACRVADPIWYGCLAPRLLDRRGWLLALSTPSSEGWFLVLYERGVAGDGSCASWRQPTSANPAIDPAWITGERERLPAEAFGELYLAVWHRDRGYGSCRTCGGITRESRRSWGYYGPEDGIQLCPECEFVLDERGIAVGEVLHGGPVRGKVVVFISDPETDARIEVAEYQSALAEAARLPMLMQVAG